MPKRILRLSGSQAKRNLGVQGQVGGAKGGFDLAKKLGAAGDSAGALKAAARVVAIRKARKSGDKKAYKAAVLENRTARLGYNQKALGLHGNGYGNGKNTQVVAASKKLIKKGIKKGSINARTQRGKV